MGSNGRAVRDARVDIGEKSVIGQVGKTQHNTLSVCKVKWKKELIEIRSVMKLAPKFYFYFFMLSFWVDLRITYHFCCSSLRTEKSLKTQERRIGGGLPLP